MFGEVKLQPGVTTESTPTLSEAQYSESKLLRFREGLAQKLGGWARYFSSNIPGVPRDLHAWEDLNGVSYVGVGTTTALGVISNNAFSNLTPQTFTSTITPAFSTTVGSTTVGVVDPNATNVTLFDSVYFNVPVSVDGIILSNWYPIDQITGTNAYNITADKGVGIAGVTNSGVVPAFTTTISSALVTVTFPHHGLLANDTVVFNKPTTVGGTTIQGIYLVKTVTNANAFVITVKNAATVNAGPVFMNSGHAELIYQLTLGPPLAASGYGIGGYGLGGYGTGAINIGELTGTPITTTDWTQDNWGSILLACPFGGPIYYWDPASAQITPTAIAVGDGPPFNGGMFVSMNQQIVVAWGSTVQEALGHVRNPLLMQWSDSGNFLEWRPSLTNQAGNFVIPRGSRIVGAIPTPLQNLIWTDIELWSMTYLGAAGELIFGFNKIGGGCGLAGSHAMCEARGNIYWMGTANFFSFTSGGVQVLPCTVWDVVFQNLNIAFAGNIRACADTPFNEIMWQFPSMASANGENDSYVKLNLVEGSWDYDLGTTMPRSAWMDQSIVGMPLGAISTGIIYQHEVSPDADGSPLSSGFTTGYFYIQEGEEFAFVDQLYPDFRYGTFNGSSSAQISITVNTINYMGDTPLTYGPFLCTAGTPFISCRIRARQMSFKVESNDIGSFWRIGKIRYRFRPDGRQ